MNVECRSAGSCYPGGVMIFVATVTPVVKTDIVESVPGGYGIGKCGGRELKAKGKEEYPISNR